MIIYLVFNQVAPYYSFDDKTRDAGFRSQIVEKVVGYNMYVISDLSFNIKWEAPYLHRVSFTNHILETT